MGKWVYCWVTVMAKREKKFDTKCFVFSYSERMIGPNVVRSMKLELSQTGHHWIVLYWDRVFLFISPQDTWSPETKSEKAM